MRFVSGVRESALRDRIAVRDRRGIAHALSGRPEHPSQTVNRQQAFKHSGNVSEASGPTGDSGGVVQSKCSSRRWLKTRIARFYLLLESGF